MTNIKLTRYILGGDWYYYKLGIDTPNIRLFYAWVRDPPNMLENCFLLAEEHHGRNIFQKLKLKLGL